MTLPRLRLWACVAALALAAVPAHAIELVNRVECRDVGAFQCNTLIAKQVIKDVIYKIALAVLSLLAIIAFIFVIYCGTQYVVSGGDSSRAQRAKTCLLYAAIGIIVSGLSGYIVNAIINTGR
ncbi:MAG: hypothetical protein COT71_02430 [Candidatus Andersenbacteria bacterium CG10_big_fil_rev_8_21_14_0_10_54_11]|uniref:TrbC/VIRB2 family protein n=1 Tax=Candidatus Andersenbacteria bacterium CG10_big_fil_rev_8_21_14_0_10_54_11 TaxID=1974485 RepID=A0A2M6WZE0_9BACT|nr:MAG: hypothetical protein COT71_02430 [Candidatus Andersenbacteria bacterium CG10_big_fil_rev_8_21_14_0_10_54_11]